MSSAVLGFGDLRNTVDLSPVAMLALTLPDKRIRLANEPATALFGAVKNDMIGRYIDQFFSDEDARRSRVAMAALAVGALDSYRARRSLSTSEGSIAVWMWIRTVTLRGGPMAVVLALPEEEALIARRSIGALFGPDALDLAVGTADVTGRIERITTASRVMLGRDQAELAGTTLTDLAHPDDADRLTSALHASADTEEDVFIRVQLRHASRGWVQVRCLIFPIPGSEPPQNGFVLAGPAEESQTGPDAVRLVKLERQLLRIAAEVHGTELQETHPFAADASRFPALNELSSRQREIVDRLLLGERIPAIASMMYLSPSTIRNHLSHVFTRFSVHTQAELLSLLRSNVSGSSRYRG